MRNNVKLTDVRTLSQFNMFNREMSDIEFPDL